MTTARLRAGGSLGPCVVLRSFRSRHAIEKGVERGRLPSHIRSMKTTEREEYYIACACCMRTTTARGRPLIDDGTVAWLGEDDKGEPYNKIERREAKRFLSNAEAQEWARASDRKPWWFWFKPESLKVYRVTQTVTVEEVEI